MVEWNYTISVGAHINGAVTLEMPDRSGVKIWMEVLRHRRLFNTTHEQSLAAHVNAYTLRALEMWRFIHFKTRKRTKRNTYGRAHVKWTGSGIYQRQTWAGLFFGCFTCSSLCFLLDHTHCYS